MAESVKRSLIPAAATILAGLIAYLVMLSASAGALDNRVTTLERQQPVVAEKIDKVLANTSDIRERLARLEAKLENKR